MNVGIKALSYCLPKRRRTNSELIEKFDEKRISKITSMTGVETRRIADTSQFSSDLAFSAAKEILEKTGVDSASIDLLLLGTQTGDYIMPSSACILQRKLGLSRACAAFDINLGCSQFVYGLGTANAWIQSGMAHRALVIAAETPSKLICDNDISTISVFGDGAVVALVEKVNKGGFAGFDFGTDGYGWKDLIVKGGGMREPDSNRFIEMNGTRVLVFAMRDVPLSIDRALKRANMSRDDVDMYVLHQASEVVVNTIANKMGIAESKIARRLSDTGNIGGGSLGLALVHAIESETIKSGDKVVLSAFGVGFSWGSIVLEWNGEEFQGSFGIE